MGICCQTLRRMIDTDTKQSVLIPASDELIRVWSININRSVLLMSVTVSSCLLISVSLLLSLFFRQQITLRRGVCLHLSEKNERGSSTNTAQPDIMQGETFPRCRVLKCQD